jgi:hypothetical protein
MRKSIFPLVLAWLLVSLGASAGQAEDSYALLFKEGTLDTVPRTATLAYERSVSAPGDRALETRSSGTVKLAFAPDDMIDLNFDSENRTRRVGTFPANVGNPLIMYFLETVVKDLASFAGGSPYYIRNRIKASLLEQRPVRELEVPLEGEDVSSRSVVLYPFKDDPASDRMRGVETLALTVTVSEHVPGWYYSLKAETTEDRGERSELPDTLPAYSNSIVFLNLGEAK